MGYSVDSAILGSSGKGEDDVHPLKGLPLLEVVSPQKRVDVP
jgi:hypothetical protein